jgi:hypothetical protein
MPTAQSSMLVNLSAKEIQFLISIGKKPFGIDRFFYFSYGFRASFEKWNG